MVVRLNKVIKEFNVGLQTVVDFLKKKGQEVEAKPSTKLTDEQYELVKKEFRSDEDLRNEAIKLVRDRLQRKEEKKEAKKEAHPEPQAAPAGQPEAARPGLKVVGHMELDKPAPKPEPKPEPTPAPEQTPVPEPAPEPKPDVKPAEDVAPASEPAAPASAPEVSAPKPVAPAPEPAAPASTPETPAPTPAPAPEVKPAPAEPKQPAQPAPEKQKPSVEERANAIGEVKDGVFELKDTPTVQGPKVVGTLDLSAINSSTRPKRRGKGGATGDKKKRARITGGQRVDISAAAKQIKDPVSNNRRGNNGAGGAGQPTSGASKRRNRKAKETKVEISDEDVARQVRETLARLTGKSKASKGAKYRKEKREQVRAAEEEQRREQKAESKVLKLTEFVTANELATMMDVPVTKVIATCMSIGIMVSINQRLDAETINLVAEEFGFKTEYVSAEVQDAVAEEEDNEEDLVPRAPIVTVMGHVDHGKTSLLDYIRKSNVIAGEAGGITQHIGAYNVTLDNGRHITFLDTPGHEAFTAMRARGAQVTDIAIIIIAADDDVMPQTKEAINHAVAANVPIVFAINKIDKPGANPEKIKESLAAMNFLVEDWGGKYQSQDISAKKGIGVPELLEKVLLEADMLELKANPNRKATGTVIESALDKGRGYVATVLVSNGTLHQGDIVLAGTNYGRVRALFDERGRRIKDVGPSMAATLLGFNGAPQAGDQFHVMETEQEAREIASKREQLQREQDLRTHKLLTLDELGRRIKQGGYQELNIIVKGDVDGSVEALSDSFIKLSTPEIAVNVIHKSVGQISENDVTLAAASQAVIVGFQVRPSQAARKLADKEGVEIRLYSVIYDAIDDVKKAMEGMLQPIIKEEVTATVEVRQVYHISKVGVVAGAYVMDGKVSRTDKARLVRDGIVVFTGAINALKRFKDDVKEVNTNFECGISLTNCNDIKEGDIIETFREVEVKQKLS